MFKVDDRTGNIITTVGLFLAVAALMYVSRVVVLVSVMSLLLAYLLEPAVTWMQHHSRLGRKNRSWAIGQVYAIGGLVLGGVGYAYGPQLVAQVKYLSAIVSGRGVRQLQMQDLFRHQDLMARVFERGAVGIAQKIDAMLAGYVRAQSALAALSFGFYIVSMLLLGFPYAGPLAVLGAVLEFVPLVGWLTTAGIIVTIGVMTHAHWAWMAG
jgi:predicted PurR-regulated permease PerM